MATLQDYLGITKLRDAWPKWKANIIAINNQVIAHVAGTADKHAAEKITYAGNIAGAMTVKEGLDLLDTRVDTIITTPVEGVSAQEIIDARGGEIALGGRLDGVDAQLAETANVKKYGAIGNDIADDTIAIQSAVNSGKPVYFPPGIYKVTATIVCSDGCKIFGDNSFNTIVKSYITGNAHVFSLIGTAGLQGITMLDIQVLGLGDTATDGYGLYVSGSYISIIQRCRFKNLGGGGVWGYNLALITVRDSYVGFNAKNPYYQNADYAAIYSIDITDKVMNNVTVDHCYVTNNKFMNGIHTSGNGIRVINNTIETSDILVKIGTTSVFTTGFVVSGNYFENSYIGSLDIVNSRDGFVNGLYISDSTTNPGAPTRSHALRMQSACKDISIIGVDFGTYGVKLEYLATPHRNISFLNCKGLNLNGTIPYGVKIDALIAESTEPFGGYGFLENRIANNTDLTTWTMNNATVTQDISYVDGSPAYTLAKAGTTSYDIYKTITMSFLTGTKVCFSSYIRNGALGIKIRGKKVSDGLYEDIISLTVGEDAINWTRRHASFVANKDYDVIQLRLCPATYSVASGSVEIYAPQCEVGTTMPSSVVKTVGASVVIPDLKGVTNGHHRVLKKILAVEGLGVGNSAVATTLGAVAKKMEVFDSAGVSLGFVPIYSSIT